MALDGDDSKNDAHNRGQSDGKEGGGGYHGWTEDSKADQEAYNKGYDNARGNNR